MVEATGQVDYINTSIGVATATLYMIEASMQVPPGTPCSSPAPSATPWTCPVVGVGRFKDPLQAERALDDGLCDLVGVVRGQIADPDFAAKARSGHATDIRTCLSCNQECVGRMGLNRWLGCIENPRTGRESTAAPRPHRAGGGWWWPAGARGAAGRGHRRRERAPGRSCSSARTGSAARSRWPPRVPSRAEFLDITRNLIVAARRLGVDVRTGVEATAELVEAERPGRGDRGHRRPPGPAVVGRATTPRVVDVRDVLEGRVHPEGRVVVVDELGFHQATSVAELLADRGCRVEIVTNGMVVGQDLGITLDMETWNVKAHAKGIGQSVDLVPMGVSPATARAATREPGRRRPVGAHPAAPPDRRPTRSAPATGWSAPCTSDPTTICGARSRTGRSRPPHRRLPGAAAGPRRGHRGPPGGGGAVTTGAPDRPGHAGGGGGGPRRAASGRGRRGGGRGRGQGHRGRDRVRGRGPRPVGRRPSVVGRYR